MFVSLAEVRLALERDELLPSFQPLVELRTGQLAGLEVLARWQHPQLGPVLPKNFISLAEENGLIGQLMQQILRKAFLSARLLPEPLVLAVNVSPVQLYDLSLPVQLCQASQQAGFPLSRVTVEITESALVNNLERARNIAHELKELGCTLALDDFGTGYSSLNHLQALPFDELKVDRSFIKSMAVSRESRKIVAAVVGLGHSLGLTTVAEGVETEQQADMLLWLGCELGQGWLYGRPVMSENIPSLVEAAPHILSSRLSSPSDSWAVSSLEAMPAQRLAQLQAIYDGAPVGLCFLDRNLRFVSLNRRLADMDGTPAAAHLGKTVKEMVPELYSKFEPYLQRALKGEAISDVEIFRPSSRPGQEGLTTLSSYQPAFDEAGEVIGVSVSVVDISEQHSVGGSLHVGEGNYRQMGRAS
jgi:PAS domain S-box-containing protein